MFYDNALDGQRKVSDAVSLLDRVMANVQAGEDIPISELLWEHGSSELDALLAQSQACSLRADLQDLLETKTSGVQARL